MPRGRALALALVLALGVSSCALSRSAPRLTPSPHRPNVVFVLADDLSTELLRYMPHVRALMHRGTSFADYIVSDSLCCPSRSSIFTGQYPHDTGVFTNDAPDGGYPAFMSHHDENRTFADTLHRTGYLTGFMGKYLNGYEDTNFHAVRGQDVGQVPPGWSEWDGIGSGYRGFDFRLNHDGVVRRVTGRTTNHYVTTVLDKRAQGFIDASSRKRTPFFLEVATFAPHKPYEPSPQDQNKLLHVTAPRGPAWDRVPTHPPTWLRGRKKFNPFQKSSLDYVERRRAESVLAIDRMVGHLENRLRADGQLRNTVFVFSSDNGLHVGAHGLEAGKLTAFDTDIRVPLVMAGPGIRAGVVDHHLVQNVDLAPTFDALAGARIPPYVDGESLVPLVHGLTPPWRRVALIEHHGPAVGPGDPDKQDFAQGNPPSYEALRGRGFLFVRYLGGEVEYYNLRRDPHELHNLGYALPAQRRRHLLAVLHLLDRCHAAACWLGQG